jgi:hypothetical protein
LAEVGRFVDEMQRQDVAALVLDQQGNGGGSFVLGYALLSRLTRQPLHTPLQRYLVSGERSVVGFGDEPVLTRRAETLRSLADDGAVATFMNDDPLFATALNFVPRTLATSRSAGEFFRFLAERARGSAGLTAPFYEFQAAVEPARAPFDRPILLLIDELNISAAEYVAATLVDSGRATSLGRTTSGAGGDQRSVVPERVCPPGRTHAEDPFAECVPPEVAAAMKSVGVASMSYTVTVGQRPSGPIENVGVAPKHEYAVTAEDLRSDFAPMKRRVLDVLSTLERP